MIRCKIPIPPSRTARARAGMATVALLVALPLFARPALWQYLTATLLAYDLLLRFKGQNSTDAEGQGDHDVSSDSTAESDAIRTGRDRP